MGGKPSRSGNMNRSRLLPRRCSSFCLVLILTTAGEARSASAVKSGNWAAASEAKESANTKQIEVKVFLNWCIVLLPHKQCQLQLISARNTTGTSLLLLALRLL